jgi:hypothetical protein
MDAREFFREVVKPNYEESLKNPHSYRLLWNALVSMNTVAEFVALERLEYSPTSRKELMQSANVLRDQSLADLKFCVETLKHIRKIEDKPKSNQKFTTVETSTGILSHDPATWRVGSYELRDVLRRAFNTLIAFPELVDS